MTIKDDSSRLRATWTGIGVIVGVMLLIFAFSYAHEPSAPVKSIAGGEVFLLRESTDETTLVKCQTFVVNATNLLVTCN